MKKLLLTLALCFSTYLAGHAKNENLDNSKPISFNSYKSSTQSPYFVNQENYPCGIRALNLLRNNKFTLYNAAYMRYLEGEVDYVYQGWWNWSKILLKPRTGSPQWNGYQRWMGTINENHLGPNGGFLFTFKLAKKSGLFSTDIATMTYRPNGSTELVLLEHPPKYYQTEFEFIVIECIKDGIAPGRINSRGYLIDPKTNRMIKAGPQKGVGRILAKLGIDYKNFNHLSEDEKDTYSWETSTTTYF